MKAMGGAPASHGLFISASLEDFFKKAMEIDHSLFLSDKSK